MEKIKATVRKIHPNKYSRNGNIFTRIEFMTDDGKWFKTDICPNYRNYRNWTKVLDEGEGARVDGLIIRKGNEIDGDSSPRLTNDYPKMRGKLPEKIEGGFDFGE